MYQCFPYVGFFFDLRPSYSLSLSECGSSPSLTRARSKGPAGSNGLITKIKAKFKSSSWPLSTLTTLIIRIKALLLLDPNLVKAQVFLSWSPSTLKNLWAPRETTKVKVKVRVQKQHQWKGKFTQKSILQIPPSLYTLFPSWEIEREVFFLQTDLRPQEERGIDNFYMSLSNWNDNAIQQLKRSHRIEQCMKWSSQAIGSYLHATRRVAVRFCSSRTLWDTNRAILGLTVLGPDWSISLSGPIFLLATLHVHFSVFNKLQMSIGPKRLVLIDQFLCPILSFSSPILHII